MKLQYSRALIFITLFSVTLVPVHVAAKENEHETPKRQRVEDKLPAKVQERVEELRQKAETFHAKRESAKKERSEQETSRTAPASEPVKLPEAKKKLCEENQLQISSTMSQLNVERQQKYDRITKISESAQQFYTTHKLSIANYDDLLKAITSAQSLANDTLQAQLSAASFTCDGDSPRAAVQSFQAKSESSKDAVMLYRDAVKSLLSTVRDAYQMSAKKEDE